MILMVSRSISARIKTLLLENWIMLQNESLGRTRGKRILDVGCGDAKFSIYLSKLGNEYIGVDVQVRRTLLPKDVNIIRADAAHLPFRDDCFDLSISRELLHHVNSPLRVIKEIQRVGKRIVIIEANKNAPYMIWAYYEGHKHFSPIEFENILRNALGINPNIRFVGIYAYRAFPIFFNRLVKVIRLVYRLKIKKALAVFVLSPICLLEDFLFFLTMFAPYLFFSSKLFANHLLALEMIFDSARA